jgi:hypothetical protein
MKIARAFAFTCVMWIAVALHGAAAQTTTLTVHHNASLRENHNTQSTIKGHLGTFRSTRWEIHQKGRTSQDSRSPFAEQAKRRSHSVRDFQETSQC